MKKALTIILLTFTTITVAQKEMTTEFYKADSILNANNFLEAYSILKKLENKCDKNDTIYEYILWYYTNAITQLEKQFRMNEQFENAVIYGLESLEIIEKGTKHFDELFASRKYWMHKNLIVSYFGLGKLDKAQEHKNILYKAYKKKQLPDGIDQFFNFTFFKWKDKNIWGYEWYPELGDPETEGSFSKIVYYIYSTNPDGSDKDQLYRLHVLKFHKFDDSVEFDYVLTKKLDTATNEFSGTLYKYTYDENIDYLKLQADIKEVLEGNIEPDTKSNIKTEDR